MIFRYSDEQRRVVIEECGENDFRLNRFEMEELASVLVLNHAAINNSHDRTLRREQIKKLQSAADLMAESALGRDLQAHIDRRKYYDQSLGKIPNAHRAVGSREALIRDALTTWVAVGNGEPTRYRNPDQQQPNGRAIRFVQACVEPVFGETTGNAVDAVIRKMRREKVFGKIGMLDSRSNFPWCQPTSFCLVMKSPTEPWSDLHAENEQRSLAQPYSSSMDIVTTSAFWREPNFC